MSMRPKTVRRLALVGGVLVVLVAALVMAVFVRQWQKDRRLEERRAEGIALHEAGEHVAAMTALKQYLDQLDLTTADLTEEDRQVMLAYAGSRLAIEEPRMAHAFQAIDWYRRAWRMDRDDREAAEPLLELYMQTGRLPEAVELASTLRPADLDQAEALHMGAIRDEAMARIQLDPNDAEIGPLLDAAERIDPTDREAARAMISWLGATGRADEAVDFAEAKERAFSGDRGWQVLALLARIAGDRLTPEQALARGAEIFEVDPETGESIAEAPQGLDEDTIAFGVGVFDSFRRFDLARVVLCREAPQASGEDIRTAAARRAWENADDEWLIETFAPQAGELESVTLGFVAAAAIRVGDDAASTRAREELAAREEDFRARAWALALDGRQALEAEAPQALRQGLEALRKAQDPTTGDALEPVYAFWSGKALDRLGRAAEARAAWRQALELSVSPGWIEPLTRTVQTLMREDRIDEAYETAREAFLRAPTGALAQIAYFGTQVAQAEAGKIDADERNRLLRRMSAFRERTTEAPQSRQLWLALAPVAAAMEARSGQPDNAREIIRGVLAEEPPAPVATLQRLAMVATVADLGMESDVLDHAEQSHGPTPEIAYARGLIASREAGSEEVLRAFDDTRASSPEGSSVEWALVRARLLAFLERPEAVSAWSELIDAHPERVDVIQAALASPALASDPGLLERVITRFRELSGADATTGAGSVATRIARARAILASPLTPRTRDEAIGLLQSVLLEAEVVQARDLLARLYLMEDSEAVSRGAAPRWTPDLAGARGQVESMALQRPGDVGLALRLARLLIRTGQTGDALTRLTDVAIDPGAPASFRLAAVRLLLDRNEHEWALNALDGVPRSLSEDLARTADSLRAEALARAGRDAEAADAFEGIVGRMVDEPDRLADLAIAIAKLTSVERGLATIERMPEGVRETSAGLRARAAFERAVGAIDRAEQLARRAVEADPEDTASWALMASITESMGDSEATRRVVAEATAAAPADLIINNIRLRLALVRSAQGDGAATAELGRLVDEVGQDASPALLAVAAAQAAGRLDDPDQIAWLASRFWDDAAVQALVARRFLDLGREDDAVAALERAAVVFPTDATIVSLAANTLIRAQRWNSAYESAEAWLRIEDAPEARIAVAVTAIALSIPERALEAVPPGQVPQALHEGARERALALGLADARARALVATDRSDEALAMLGRLGGDRALVTEIVIPIGVGATASLDEAQRWIAAVEEARIGGFELDVARAWVAVSERFDGAEAPADRAIELARALVEQDASDVDALTVLASALEASGRFTDAVRVREQTLGILESISPSDVRIAFVCNDLAIALIRADGGPENAERAVRLAERARTIVEAAGAGLSDFVRGAVLDTLGQARLAGGDVPGAVEALEQAIQLRPDSSTVQLNLADALSRQTPLREDDRRRAARLLNAARAADALSAEQRDRARETRARLDRG